MSKIVRDWSPDLFDLKKGLYIIRALIGDEILNEKNNNSVITMRRTKAIGRLTIKKRLIACIKAKNDVTL